MVAGWVGGQPRCGICMLHEDISCSPSPSPPPLAGSVRHHARPKQSRGSGLTPYHTPDCPLFILQAVADSGLAALGVEVYPNTV